jgi:hypothetical protein
VAAGRRSGIGRPSARVGDADNRAVRIGDALRNVLYDLRLPLFAVIGARSWLVEDSRDSAKRFALRLLEAWQLDWTLIASEADKPKLAGHYRRCQAAGRAGAVLIAEGRM